MAKAFMLVVLMAVIFIVIPVAVVMYSLGRLQVCLHNNAEEAMKRKRFERWVLVFLALTMAFPLASCWPWWRHDHDRGRHGDYR